MKISDAMRYPHPMLSDSSPDFNSSEFICSFEQQMTSDAELKLSSEMVLRCADLNALVSNQRATTGYFVVCRRTYFNVLQAAPLGKSERFFDASKLFGTVVIRPAIWTLEDVKAFVSPLMDREFGQKVAIPKGALVALGPEFRFSMDKKKFKPFESIFELAIQADLEPDTIAVDAMRDRIAILAEPKTHKSLAGMRGMSAGQNILLSSVYMPAIMDVLAALQNGDVTLTTKSWYRVFKAKCDEIGVDPASPNQSPLTVAQKLLKAPLKRSIALAEKS